MSTQILRGSPQTRGDSGEAQLDVRNAHALPAAQVLAQVASSASGLSEEEASARLARHGRNVIERLSRETWWRILYRQFDNPLIWVLIAAAGAAIALGEFTDGAVVLAVVGLNALIGFVQEYRARGAIESLRSMVPESATVLRGGRAQTLAVTELAPGDIVQLAAGDRVPADMRFIAVKSLRIDEAPLTGESTPVDKSSAQVAVDAPLAERTCMGYGGTLVRTGTATGVVISTGGHTELGRINTMIGEVTELETPLTRALANIGKHITVVILVVSLAMIAIGTFRAEHAGLPLDEAFRETLIFAIALAVGAIPEGLPAIVTIALAIGVRRMAARRAIIRKLPAVETLGSTTVICSDKTGTLTRNEMTVSALWAPESGRVEFEGIGYAPHGGLRREGGEVLSHAPEQARQVLIAAALCSDATLEQKDGEWVITGDPTEGALIVAAEKVGLRVPQLREEHPRHDLIPFESEHRFMATLHANNGSMRLLIKGAPEAVLPRTQSSPGGAEHTQLQQEIERMGREGMRVLALAEKPFDSRGRELAFEDAESGFRLLGLVGMIDPPRSEAVAAIAACANAGIEVKMITGDHAATAKAIGQQLGLARADHALQGSDLAVLDGRGLEIAAGDSAVFARVAPEHKLRLVESLQRLGHVVAMTGDGVNDAPALKQSNIGVAMGITGTSVSKEAADMVLTDDNFATIVAAVEEGRRVYDNLIKSLVFVLPTNLALALIMIVAVVAFPFNAETQLLLLPISATQLLWINLVATVTLALPLAFEAKEPDVMQRPPRKPEEPIISRIVMMRTVLAAVLMTTSVVGLFQWTLAGDINQVPHGGALAEAQTMAVTTAIAFQVFYLFHCRSLRSSLAKVGFFSNGWVFAGVLGVCLLQAAFIFFPPLARVFGTTALSLREILTSVAVGAIGLPLVSLEKWLTRRWLPGN